MHDCFFLLSSLIYTLLLMQDLVPCIMVTFEKEQVVGWRGNDYKPPDDGYFQIENYLIVQKVIWVLVQRRLIS